MATSAELQSLAEEVGRTGSECLTFAGDVRDEEAMSAAVLSTVDAFGRIDILFNNADICAFGLAHELSEDAWDTMIDLNLMGAWLVARRIIPVMILVDRFRTLLVELDSTSLPRCYSVVVTRHNFAPLATDLALLLAKSGDAPYPWVVNILDLRSIADAWEHLGWGVRELENYLRGRLPLHGRVFAPDELEIALICRLGHYFNSSGN